MEQKSGIISPKTRNKISGNIGEAKSVLYLKNLGYEILETNYKLPFGEIDIIAKDGERVIFVEVKVRNSIRHGYPREAVTKEKQQTIRRVAECYLKKKRALNRYTRFDVIEILGDKITHLKNAF